MRDKGAISWTLFWLCWWGWQWGIFSFQNRGILQLLCTLGLIFSMGVMLGRKENFLAELTSMGLVSFLFFLIPTAFSVLLVYFLTKRFLKGK